jgi:hypothetical protein
MRKLIPRLCVERNAKAQGFTASVGRKNCSNTLFRERWQDLQNYPEAIRSRGSNNTLVINRAANPAEASLWRAEIV